MLALAFAFAGLDLSAAEIAVFGFSRAAGMRYGTPSATALTPNKTQMRLFEFMKLMRGGRIVAAGIPRVAARDPARTEP